MKIKTKFNTLKKIYHISDIQIRNLKRHIEYEQVFNNLYDYIKKDTKDAVVFIGGDIAHSKTDMSPELVDQLSRLFKNLSELCPTLLIAGNHDCNLNNKSRLDVLTPIVDNIKNENLHYLKDTGVYYIADTAFSVLDVWDDEASKIPDPADINSKNKILLYHGTIDRSETDLGFQLQSKIKLTDFDGYDMVLLGDIHKMQTMQRYKKGKVVKPIVRYCGSLVQQNHGESLLGHGVSVWDVKNRSFEHKEIKNEYGYYTITIDNGLVPKADDMPEFARLRVKVTNTSNTDLKKALAVIRHRHNLKEIIVMREDNFKVDAGNTTIVDFGDIADPDVQNGLIENYLKTKTTASDDTVEKVKKINTELSSMIVAEEISRNISWKPIKFEFSNMFSYGEDNVIDFSKCNGIMGIFSPNASGKSSILDALTFCLFDKSTRAWKAENVMNHSKSNFHCKLEFEVGNDTYIVERLGAINKNGSTRVEVNFSTLSPEGELISLNGDQRNTTNKNIRKLIGTYDDFIMTSFSSQNNSSIFLDQNQTEKKEILGKFLGLSIFDKLFKVAKEESSGIYSMLKNFLDVDYDQQISDIETELKSSITSFNTLEESKTSKESILEKHKNKVIELVKEIRPIDASISDINVLSKELEGQDNDLNTLSENLIQLERNLSKVSDAKELINNRLKSNKFTDIERKIAEHSNIQDDYSKTKIEIDRLKDNVTNKLDKITKLGNLEYDADCSFCMGNIFVKDAIKTKEELVSDKLRANQLITKVKTLDNKLEINKDVPLIHTEFLGLNDELNDLKFSNQTIDAKISSARSNIKLAESNKQIVISNITRCKKYQNDIHHNNKIQQSLDDEKANEQSVYAEVKALTQDLQHSIGKKVSLETRKKELITTIDKVKDLEDKYEAYKYYLMAIDKNGISYDLISKVLVNVETEVNNILSQIVDFQIVFDMDGKNVNNYIVYDNDKSWALEMASGMEKFISTLAIRIALTNISNLPRPNFIAIDEGWGTLDSDNLNSAQQLFQYLKNIYKFSLIISHIDTMRDFTDDLLEISVVDGYSQITF